MKIIKGLDERVEHFKEVPADQVELLPTFRRMFMNVVGGCQAANGAEAIELYNIGLKLKGATENTAGEVRLENAEVNLLRAKCEKNEEKYQAHFVGQLLLKIDSAEKTE